jgi:hypothetical protein
MCVRDTKPSQLSHKKKKDNKNNILSARQTLPKPSQTLPNPPNPAETLESIVYG